MGQSIVNTVKDKRLRMAVASGAALVAIAGLATACNKSNEAPSTTTTTTTTTTSAPPTSAATPTPTEKGINPTGGNLFTPGVTATPAPNVPGGQHPGINGNP
jgi:hypothetical protein